MASAFVYRKWHCSILSIQEIFSVLWSLRFPCSPVVVPPPPPSVFLKGNHNGRSISAKVSLAQKNCIVKQRILWIPGFPHLSPGRTIALASTPCWDWHVPANWAFKHTWPGQRAGRDVSCRPSQWATEGQRRRRGSTPSAVSPPLCLAPLHLPATPGSMYSGRGRWEGSLPLPSSHPRSPAPGAFVPTYIMVGPWLRDVQVVLPIQSVGPVMSSKLGFFRSCTKMLMYVPA